MIQNIITRYKRLRTNSFLANCYENRYAFIGMGQHSLNNLYPVINYMQVPLKYIGVTSESKAKLISRKYRRVIATTSIDQILNDSSVKGIFVATTPSAHFSLAQKVLSHNKSLFIEKPPCTSLDQLNKLITLQNQHSDLTITIGLQKRYSPSILILKKYLQKDTVINYHLRYCTGAYPEGSPLLDLFIHPIDLAIYLFGTPELISCEKLRNNSYILLLKHSNIVGTLELSTNYTWDNAIEDLAICSVNGAYNLSQMERLTFTPQISTFCGLPLEKIFHQHPSTKILSHRNNFVPILSNNQIYIQGFYNEILSFVNSIESATKTSTSNFTSLIDTYTLINKLQSSCL